MYKLKSVARSISDSGLQVISIKEGGKSPLHKWKEDTDIEEVLSYGSDRIGLRMGDMGLVAIDVDSKNSTNPDDFKRDVYSRLEMAGIPWEKTIIQETQSGGFHLIFRTGLEERNRVLSKNSEGKPLIETRGQGGYIVLYEAEKFTNVAGLELLTDEESDSLMGIFSSFNQWGNQSNTCLDILIDQGWTTIGTNNTGTLVLRGGNPASKSSGIVFNDNDLAYIYSTSTCLPANKPLTPEDLLRYFNVRTDTDKQKGSRYIYESLKSVCTRASTLPPAPQLFGEFWHEGELCVLFGQTNSGKTVLAYQLAIAIALGEQTSDFWSTETKKQTVLFFDLEMSERQVSKRLGGLKLPENLFRAIPSREYQGLGNAESIYKEISQAVDNSKATVVIIDNLSVLYPDNEKAADATKLLSLLNRLKSNLKISVLAVGHTPKISVAVPLEIHHLAGSAQIGNLIDSSFVIGKTNEPKQRYLKQVKCRETEFRFTADNVLVLELNSEAGLRLIPIGLGSEYDLLPNGMPLKDRNETRDAEIVRMKHSGASMEDIMDKYKIGRSTYYKIVSPVQKIN